MKIVAVVAGGLAFGLLAGAGVSGIRLKGEILEARALAAADSAAAARTAARTHEEEEPAATESPEHDPARPAVELPPDAEETAGTDSVVPQHVAPPEDGDVLVQVSTPVEGVGPDRTIPADPTEPDTAAATPPQAAARNRPTTPEGKPDWAAGLNAEGAKKLSKIFAAMKPQDAADVLVGMSDDEVKAILLQMSDRQAGPIVGAFPAERAASLSRDVLRTPRTGGVS